MRKLFFSIAAAIVLLIPVQSASAHELITDDTKTKGAIFHTMPDDNPIAGQQVTLYFDAQGELLSAGSAVKLRVEQPNGKSNEAAMIIDGSLATATYVFPMAGLYKLVFTITSGADIYIFRQSQEVFSATASRAQDNSQYAWAKVMLMASGVGFVLLAVLVFVRRKAIVRQSRF